MIEGINSILKVGVWVKLEDLLDSFLAGEPFLPLVVGKHILLVAVLVNIIYYVLQS
jgi:hypothetical protein